MEVHMEFDPENPRREYARGKLDESQLPFDPMDLFAGWLEEAQASGNPEPNAMTLSTVGRDGQPSSRIVLLKMVENGALIFFTNYHSRKAREIAGHIRVAASFFWPELERQVRITGIARHINDSDSDRYFRSRPIESQISAWASPQSDQVPDRAYLEQEYEKYRKKFGDTADVPRPAHWGGYAIKPSRMEFWQGRPGRLNDRIEYTRMEDQWSMARLAP